MWEIFSGGKSPYPATNSIGLNQMLERGERMPYNTACTKDMCITEIGNTGENVVT